MRELVAPTWSLDVIRARVVSTIHETHDVRSFALEPNHLWRGHRAGQFVALGVEVNGRLTTRCYSLSSAPSDELLRITVKRVPGGRVSNWLHDRVGVGDLVTLSPAAGDFVLDDSDQKRLLLSGGSGITPLMSIVRDLAAHDALRDVRFVHAARSNADLIFGDELARLSAAHPGLRVVNVLEDDALSGRLDSAALMRLVPDLPERSAMMCGPAGMMSALAPTWSRAQLGHRLRIERFAPASRPPKRTSAPPTHVRLTLLGAERMVQAAGTGTLLEELERAGEAPAHGCRMGICNTCLCRKRSGVVENVITGELSGASEENIRLCVSRATTDLELAL